MPKRLSSALFPVAILIAFLAIWVALAERRTATPAVSAAQSRPGPAVASAPTEASLPAPRPAGDATNTASQEPSPSARPAATPSAGEPVAAPKPGTNRSSDPSTRTSYGPSDEGTPPSTSRGAAEGDDRGYSAGRGTPPYDGGESSKYDTQPGASKSDTEPGGKKPSGSGLTSMNPFGWGTTPSTSSDTKGETPQTQVTREAAYAFHVFDGFEAGNGWAVESAADHAELSVVEENATEGKKALKATFQAFGKGNFELRREVGLDLSKAKNLLVDVYNDAGPMDLELAFRAGYNTTQFRAPARPLQAGWNKDLAFPIDGLASGEGGWGSSWSWSRDSVSRISLIFRERDEKRGSVTIDNLRFDRPATELGQKGKPVLAKITASGTAIERYEPIELTIDFKGDYQNFFDRGQIDIRATFFAPSGKRTEVHGFVYAVDDAAAKPVWKVRFAPTEVGLWRYDVAIKDANGEATSAIYEFLCRRASEHRGFIRVAKNDPAYFEFDDGSLYYPLGQNVCWATNYDYFLEKIQSYGGNYVRVWLCPWNLQLEDPKEPGKYDLRAAQAIDDLLGLCRKRGVYVQLVLRYHGMSTDSWDKNPYNTANGGPCKLASDFFTDGRAKDLHRSFLDYVVARWGHSPAVFAWELWNEADLARADRESDLVDWHRDMAAYLKKIDPNRHLVTTSVASPGRCTGLFELPDIDFVPVHFYAPDMFARIPEAWLLYRRLRKPVFIGEFSSGFRPADDLDDAAGVRLHAGFWLALTTPLAGNAMPWWWDTYVDKNKLYFHLAALARFARGIDPRGRNYELVRSKVQISEGVWANLQGLLAPSEAYLWVHDEERILRPERAERPLLPAPRPVRLDGMLGGTFQIEVWDPYEGKVIAQSTATTADGTLKFDLPACNRDVAVKVYRDGSARPRLEW